MSLTTRPVKGLTFGGKSVGPLENGSEVEVDSEKIEKLAGSPSGLGNQFWIVLSAKLVD